MGIETGSRSSYEVNGHRRTGIICLLRTLIASMMIDSRLIVFSSSPPLFDPIAEVHVTDRYNKERNRHCYP
jgi:hypothetical protein